MVMGPSLLRPRVHDDIIFIAMDGGRACNRQKFETGRIEIEHIFTQVCTSMSYKFTIHCYPYNYQDVSTQS